VSEPTGVDQKPSLNFLKIDACIAKLFRGRIPLSESFGGRVIATQKETIPDLLLKNIPRPLVLAVEEAFSVGAQRAYSAAHGMDEGHLPHVVGQLRHFHMNEAFHRALAANNASPCPIRGSGIVTGRTGVFMMARFNAKDDLWNNARRSNTRRQMSEANRAIEPLVQPGLFGGYGVPTDGVAFFVACFACSLRIQPEAPVTMQIAVPDRYMKRWLFRESLDKFIQRYDVPATLQDDMARPKLKKNIRKNLEDGTAQ
jgi:hypothetical protein